MNLLFDASVIGLSRQDLNSRTGVFRYTENLIKGLLKHPEIPLHLSSSEGYRPLIELHKYQYEHPEFYDIPVLENHATRAAYELLWKMRPEDETNLNVVKKLKRKIAWEGMSYLEKHSTIFRKKKLESFQIFHSPFWPVPKAIQNNKKIKKFLTIHDLYSLKNGLKGDFELSLLNSIGENDWVFAVSEATKRDFLEYKPGFNPEHVIVTYESVSDTLFPVIESDYQEYLSQLGIKSGSYFLTVGAVHGRKNTKLLIQAFHDYVQSIQDRETKLVVVGPPLDHYTKELFQIPDIKALGNQLKFTGFLEDKNLAALYQGAIAFLYPSLYEGFGIPVLEAMKLGCPVIASNNSSIPEVAGEAALLISPTVKEEITSAMMNVLSNIELRSTLIEKGKIQAKKFSWEECTERTIEGYEAALRSEPAS